LGLSAKLCFQSGNHWSLLSDVIWCSLIQAFDQKQLLKAVRMTVCYMTAVPCPVMRVSSRMIKSSRPASSSRFQIRSCSCAALQINLVSVDYRLAAFPKSLAK